MNISKPRALGAASVKVTYHDIMVHTEQEYTYYVGGTPKELYDWVCSHDITPFMIVTASPQSLEFTRLPFSGHFRNR